jgi:hypothetical protein
MPNTFTGVGILWGFPSTPTATTLTGLGVLSQIQSLDLNVKAQKDQIKDGVNNTSAVVFSDHEQNVKIDFIPTSSTNTGNFTISSLPAIGATVALTDASFSVISATFMVDDVTISRGNTKAAMATISLSRYLNNTVP